MPELESNQTIIEEPNLDNLRPWLNRYIIEPMPSFNHVPSRRKQLELTRRQYLLFAKGLRTEGIPDGKIQDFLIKSVTANAVATSEHK